MMDINTIAPTPSTNIISAKHLRINKDESYTVSN